MKFSFCSNPAALFAPFFKTGILGATALILCVMACQKDAQTEIRQNKMDPRLLAAIEQLGLKSEGAFLDNAGNVIVEGDIRLNIAELNMDAVGQISADRQRVVGEHCVRTYIETGTTLKYYISNDFDDLWKEAIKSGVAAWENERNNCAFEEVGSPQEASIVFLRDDNMGTNLYGIADFPCMNHGREIRLSVHEVEEDHGTTPIFDCIRNVATHEFGHSLGFHHTDSQAELLSGTPSNDPTSIMLDGVSWPIPLGLQWFGTLPGPDADDQKMAEYVFPRDGAHVEIGQVKGTRNLNNTYSIHAKYHQITAFCYHLEYELKSGENLLESGSFFSNGLATGSFSCMGTYPPGVYTLILCGKNYARDYNSECAMKSSKTFMLNYLPPPPEDE